jgi:Co/Zn/Cd efflux system component
LHATVGPGADRAAARRAIRERLRSRFGVGHATIEIEEEVSR